MLKDDGSAAARQDVLDAFHRLGTTGEGIEQYRMVSLQGFVPGNAEIPPRLPAERDLVTIPESYSRTVVCGPVGI
ncbi:hypothetical protein [Streptomyces sp. NPDC001594]|uniref:hypothetical protein n=1 Tax=Streptomyces sp. NPDC001594 TaxID=3364590 RepID=UPI0036B181F2